MAADIVISDLTNGTITTNSDNEYVWDGTGIFDKLMEAVNSNIKIEYDNGRITGSDYANVYLGAMQSVIQQSVQYTLQEKVSEAQIDDIQATTAAKDYNLTNLQPIAKNKATEELLLMTDTHASKVSLAGYQSDKVGKDVDMVSAQITALQEQVIDNRYIKAIDSLSSVYGTFGAGGINVDQEQWGVYYTLISELIEDLRDYKGAWDATGVFPGPADGVKGDFYVVSIAGNTELDGITPWAANDIAFYDGFKWKKMEANPSTAGIGRV